MSLRQRLLEFALIAFVSGIALAAGAFVMLEFLVWLVFGGGASVGPD